MGDCGCSGSTRTPSQRQAAARRGTEERQPRLDGPGTKGYVWSGPKRAKKKTT